MGARVRIILLAHWIPFDYFARIKRRWNRSAGKSLVPRVKKEYQGQWIVRAVKKRYA